jgi:hypothetical protein
MRKTWSLEIYVYINLVVAANRQKMREGHAAFMGVTGNTYKISPGKTEGRLDVEGGIHLGLVSEK